MIISMKLHSTKEEIEQVCERIRDFGYKIHAIEGEERVVIGVVGVGDVTACLESVEAMPQVEKAVRISAPYKFVSKEYRTERSRIRVRRLRDRRRRVHRDGRAVLGGIAKSRSCRRPKAWRRRAPSCCAAERSSRALRPTIFRAWKTKG